MLFLNFWLGINIFIFIITIFITLCFVLIDVLAFFLSHLTLFDHAGTEVILPGYLTSYLVT